jgi:hypothetical protein
MEHRTGLPVDVEVTEANGFAEREAALTMLDRLPKRVRRTTRHAGCRASQRLRKRVEEIFGWGKDGRPMRRMKVASLAKVSFAASLTVGCYALLRVARLTAPPPLVPT